MQAQRRPGFDPLPSPSCRPRQAKALAQRQACWVHRTQTRPAAAPARGREPERRPRGLRSPGRVSQCKTLCFLRASHSPGGLRRSRRNEWRGQLVGRRPAGIAPSPGQGDEPGPATALRAAACLASQSRMQAAKWTGWDGGRIQAQRWSSFDPHPNPSCRPRQAAGLAQRQACLVHRTQARPAAAPARGRGPSHRLRGISTSDDAGCRSRNHQPLDFTM